MTSGELAGRAAVNKETLRFYERRGLLREPERTEGGYRTYDLDDLRRIQFIKNAQAFAFSLDEIRELLAIADAVVIDKEEARKVASAKVLKIDHQIKNLRQLRRVLNELITKCAASEGTPECPIIESLAGSGDSDTEGMGH